MSFDNVYFIIISAQQNRRIPWKNDTSDAFCIFCDYTYDAFLDKNIYIFELINYKDAKARLFYLRHVSCAKGICQTDIQMW